MASTDTAANINPVYANAQQQRVCRVLLGGNTYAGVEQTSGCSYVLNGQTVVNSSYSVAIGLGKWEGKGLAGAATLGDLNGLPTRVCRARIDDRYVPGYLQGVTPQCQVPGNSNTHQGPYSVADYEQLYDFNAAGDFQIRNRDLCLTAPDSTGQFATMLPCVGANNSVWRLQSASTGYRLESARLPGQCLDRAVVNLFVATGVVGVMSPCNISRVLNPIWVTDTTYRLREPGTGEVLARGNPGFQSRVPLTFRQPANVGEEGFELLTLNEASRRLSVLSYNIMMLPAAQLPGLKQNERARLIPASLDQLGILADVLTFQEGFQTSARNELFLKLVDYGYLFMSGVPDWPKELYRTDALNVLTNGGVFTVSRWPLERIAYHRFLASSTDGGFDMTGLDAFAAKGVTYVRVNKLGRRYHVFTTHLQAGSPEDEGAVRQAQLREMREFANRMLAGVSADDGIIFTGDFNIDMEADVSNYNYMLTTLGASFVNAPRPVGNTSGQNPRLWTVDPDQNRITQERQGDNKEKKWLDYLFIGNSGAPVDRASYLVFQPKTPDAFNITIRPLVLATPGLSFSTTDLSDHGAVFARYVFRPSASLVQPTELVQTTLLTRFENADIPDGYISFDGGSLPTPQTITAERDVAVTVSAPTYLPGPEGYRFAFNNWENGGAQEFSYVPKPDGKLTAIYRRQVQVRARAVPENAGTFTNAGQYFDPGSRALITATPLPGFRFTGFSAPLVTTNSQLDLGFSRSPVDVVGNFAPLGAPRLFLTTAAAREHLPNQIVRIPLRAMNTGVGGASNVRAQLVRATVLAGSGSLVVTPASAVAFGTVPANVNGEAQSLDVVWPATATRVRLDFIITADGNYSVPFTLTLFR